ncbi:hypothetical protein VNO78_07512 [Psophocarpus tetragonolobus]|uniref:Bulb-type lectin domain-containing protein n=1 Tax=Psophocarpus tetragonolobus TaxID=3891 RepID=A0AAN9SUC5_PSOTE
MLFHAPLPDLVLLYSTSNAMSLHIFLPCILALVSLPHLNSLKAIEIELNTSITTGSNSTWKSPSGDFEFGFYTLPSGLFLVGIWYGRILERTLVWYRSPSVEPNSQIQFTSAGQLVVAYPNGTIAHTIYSGGNGGAATSAHMQDDGNFVMKDSNLRPVWESFNSPANTILPGQTLQNTQIIYSKGKGDSDYSLGNHMLQMQRDGNLLLKASQWSDPAYWYTSTLTPNVSLVFNATTALMFLVSGTRNIYSLNKNTPIPVKGYYHRATIDESGNFNQYAYHKRNGTSWRRVWRAVDDPCRVNAVCGVYGLCTSPDNEAIKCECIPGYIPLDHKDVSKGCHPPVVINNYCEEINFKLLVFEDTDFQFDSNFFHITNVDLESCKKAVMDDCNIVAATYDASTSTCAKKRLPLLNARNSSSSKGQIALLKVPNNVGPWISKIPKKKSFNVRIFLKAMLAVTATLAGFFGALAVYHHPFTRRLTRRKRNIESRQDEKDHEDDDLVLSNWVLRCIVSRKLEVVVRHDLEVLNNFKRFEEMALVGLWCVHPNPALRPSMKQVVQMLDGTVEVEVPPLVYDRMMANQGL